MTVLLASALTSGSTYHSRAGSKPVRRAGTGPCPGLGVLTEFGAVDHGTRRTFRGVLHDSEPDPANPALSVLTGGAYDAAEVFGAFRRARDWQRFRVTPHDHDPVNDAMGNVEAFDTIQRLHREGRLR